MDKSFLFKLLLILSLAAAAILWLLSVAMPTSVFADPNFPIASWAIVLVAGGWGITFILRALLTKASALPVTLKRLWVIMGVGLVLLAVLVIINIYALSNNLYLPVIAVAGVAALLIMLFATGGKKWDQGDNKKVGYKDYWARRAEKEKAEAEEKERNQ